MKATLADSRLPPSAVHALVEIGARGSLTATALCELLVLEKSSVSRMVRKLIDAHLLVEEISMADARARRLSLTDDGRATLAAIDRFANAQVNSALELLAAGEGQAVLDGLECYAQALRTCRLGKRERRTADVTIANGYRPGVIGRTVEMHARYYGRTVAFGQFFECNVASELAEFAGRLEHPGNGLWVAERGSDIVGAIAIDGEDLGAGSPICAGSSSRMAAAAAASANRYWPRPLLSASERTSPRSICGRSRDWMPPGGFMNVTASSLPRKSLAASGAAKWSSKGSFVRPRAAITKPNSVCSKLQLGRSQPCGNNRRRQCSDP